MACQLASSGSENNRCIGGFDNGVDRTVLAELTEVLFVPLVSRLGETTPPARRRGWREEGVGKKGKRKRQEEGKEEGKESGESMKRCARRAAKSGLTAATKIW